MCLTRRGGSRGGPWRVGAARAVAGAGGDVLEDVLDEAGRLAALAVAVALDLRAVGKVEELRGVIAHLLDVLLVGIAGVLGEVEPVEGAAVAAELGHYQP